MRRRDGQRSLLDEGDDQTQYVVDTSSWIALNNHPDRGTLWPIVEGLIVADRLFSPAEVIREVVSARDLIEPYVDLLTRCDRNDVEYLLKVGVFTSKYRRMCKPDGPKTKADPFLLALGYLDGYTIVAEESLKRSRSKIPGVCKLEGVCCVTLEQMCALGRGAGV
jgi:hypothetical protein